MSILPRFPIPAVIAVLVKDDALLLICRKTPPDVGMWGFPGGKMDFGETMAQAAVRELCEETGVVAEAQGVLTVLDSLHKDEAGNLTHHFVITAIACTWIAGDPVAADDAAIAEWVPFVELCDGQRELIFAVDRVARMAMEAAGRPCSV
ncbi:NUDIX hydrolase [uncultured Oxalicibacterium sp.]|uniref:NUDIX hydrolase n=1 Tax=uncultured Oxalicibacterium sp. TaxID=1168540 RepID=UPI0025FE517F|nr:NUDIX hydrolase [uncultured Oxalicibacterium sp.]